MLPAGVESLQSVLPVSSRLQGEFDLDAVAGRGVHPASLSGCNQADGLVEEAGLSACRNAAYTALAAVNGADGHLPRPQPESPCSGAQDLSVPFAQCTNRASQPSLECRHNVCPAQGRLYLLGGDH